MSHKTTEIDWKQLNNGQVAVLIRCCDDDRTDHWHTMAVIADEAERDTNLSEVHHFVAAQHAAVLQTRQQKFPAIRGGRSVDHPEDVLEKWKATQKEKATKKA